MSNNEKKKKPNFCMYMYVIIRRHVFRLGTVFELSFVLRRIGMAKNSMAIDIENNTIRKIISGSCGLGLLFVWYFGGGIFCS